MTFFNHYTLQPIPDPIVLPVVVTQDFNLISDIKFLIIFWGS